MRAIFANSLDVMLDAEFDESKIKRVAKGEHGGEFTSKGGASKAGAGPESKKKSVEREPGGEAEEPESEEEGEESEAARGGKSGHLIAASADREQWPEHIKSLVIPPAWTDLKISPDANADLLAIGKDAAGRPQYVYSDKWKESQAALKFARMESLRKDLPMIDGQLKQLHKSPDRNKRDLADCAILIMRMGVRPGSDTDTKAKAKAYGATTLEGKHIVEDGGQVFLRFVGKKGIALNLPVEDKPLAANLSSRAKEAGPDGRLFGDVRDGSLLQFVHAKLDHGDYKTKDFRTALANDLAAAQIKKLPKPTNIKEYKKSVREVAKSVSAKLGNTPLVCLQSYISPETFTGWRGAMEVEAPDKGAKKKAGKKQVAKKTAAKKSAATSEPSGAHKAWATRKAKLEAAA